MYTFHLLPNAHLDPVWFWDWREGLNEGIITTRTVLDLMDEFQDLTFMRGEAVRLFWNERLAWLKLLMPIGATAAEYERQRIAAPRDGTGDVAGGRLSRCRRRDRARRI